MLLSHRDSMQRIAFLSPTESALRRSCPAPRHAHAYLYPTKSAERTRGRGNKPIAIYPASISSIGTGRHHCSLSGCASCDSRPTKSCQSGIGHTLINGTDVLLWVSMENAKLSLVENANLSLHTRGLIGSPDAIRDLHMARVGAANCLNTACKPGRRHVS